MSVELELIIASIILAFAAAALLLIFSWKDPREKAIQALKDAGATSRETAVNIKDITSHKSQVFILKSLMDAEMQGRTTFVLKEQETGKIYLGSEFLASPKVNLKTVAIISTVPITLLILALFVGLTGFEF